MDPQIVKVRPLNAETLPVLRLLERIQLLKIVSIEPAPTAPEPIVKLSEPTLQLLRQWAGSISPEMSERLEREIEAM